MSKFTSTSSSCLEPVAVVPYTFTRYNSGTALAAQVQKYSVNHRRGRRYYKVLSSRLAVGTRGRLYI